MRAAVRNTSSFPRVGTASSARHWATMSWRSRYPEGGSNPAVDLAICHDAVAWTGYRFIVNLFFGQTATLVLTSAFQGVPALAGERFGGWPWRTNCSSGACRSPRPRIACASCSQELERLNRL